MKALYISDLDGTLLNSEQILSQITINTINKLVKNGVIFSYATARSLITASKVTAGLDAEIPVIVYNGAFIINNRTHEILFSNYFQADDVSYAKEILSKHGIYPIVYSYIDGTEKFSWLTEHTNQGMDYFLDSRKYDIRLRPLSEREELYAGHPFYITCIDDAKQLFPAYELFKSDIRFNCIYQKDIYSGEQWFEILPAKATKANAALQLKGLFDCDKIVSFGDGKNDISLFRISDECYAVENAVTELKKIATGIIGSNNNDGVAEFLIERYNKV